MPLKEPLLAAGAKEAHKDEEPRNGLGIVHVPALEVERRQDPPRIIKDGVVAMAERRGGKWYLGDAYFFLLSRPWWQLILLLLLGYVVSSVFFAVLYTVVPGALMQEDEEVTLFSDVFVFAASIMADLEPTAEPRGPLQAVYLLEGAFQLIALAVMVGVVVDRITHPTARVEFSSKALITRFDDQLVLQFRAANERDSPILEADLRMFVIVSYQTKEGHAGRRAHELHLLRHHMPLFHLSWTAFHVIDEESPLHGMTAKKMIEDRMEVFLFFSGVESTHGEEVRRFHSYVCEDIVVDGKFADMIEWNAKMEPILHLSKLDEVQGGDSNWTGPLYDPKVVAKQRWSALRSTLAHGGLATVQSAGHIDEESDSSTSGSDGAAERVDDANTVSSDPATDIPRGCMPEELRRQLAAQRRRFWEFEADTDEAHMCADLSVLTHSDHGDAAPPVGRHLTDRRTSLRRASTFSTRRRSHRHASMTPKDTTPSTGAGIQ